MSHSEVRREIPVLEPQVSILGVPTPPTSQIHIQIPLGIPKSEKLTNPDFLSHLPSYDDVYSEIPPEEKMNRRRRKQKVLYVDAYGNLMPLSDEEQDEELAQRLRIPVSVVEKEVQTVGYGLPKDFQMQSIETDVKQIQTEKEEKVEISEIREPYPPSLFAFFARVTDPVCKYLEENLNTMNKCHKEYQEALGLVDDLEPKRILKMKSAKVLNGFQVSCLSWSRNGGQIAVGHSVAVHEGWCRHEARVSIWNINLLHLDPKTKKPRVKEPTDNEPTKPKRTLLGPKTLKARNCGMKIPTMTKSETKTIQISQIKTNLVKNMKPKAENLEKNNLERKSHVEESIAKHLETLNFDTSSKTMNSEIMKSRTMNFETKKSKSTNFETHFPKTANFEPINLEVNIPRMRNFEQISFEPKIPTTFDIETQIAKTINVEAANFKSKILQKINFKTKIPKIINLETMKFEANPYIPSNVDNKNRKRLSLEDLLEDLNIQTKNFKNEKYSKFEKNHLKKFGRKNLKVENDSVFNQPQFEFVFSNCITAMKFHPTNYGTLVIGLRNGNIAVLNIEAKDEKIQINKDTHTKEITDIQWIHANDKSQFPLPIGFSFATCSKDASICLWTLNAGGNRAVLCKRFIAYAEFLPGEIKIGNRFKEGLRDLPVTSISFATDDPTTMLFSTTGGFIFQGSLSNTLEIELSDDNAYYAGRLDVKKFPFFEPFENMIGKNLGLVASLDCSPFLRNVFSYVTLDGRIGIQNLFTPLEPVIELFANSFCGSQIQWGVRPHVFGVLSGRTVGIYDLSKDRHDAVNTLTEKHQLNSFAFNSGDPQVMAVGDCEGQVCIWQLPNFIVTPTRNEVQYFLELISNDSSMKNSSTHQNLQSH